MNHSLACTNLVKSFEGFRNHAYKDAVGVLTIGYGHIAGVRPNDTCTEEQAAVWLDCDLQMADRAISKLVTAPLEQEQFDALASFVYNLGIGSLAHSTLLKKVNACDWDGAASEFMEWTHAGGKVLEGLVRRRAAESRLFMSAPSIRLVPSKDVVLKALEDNDAI